jgi:membrane fusion protein, multidrug efflux system
MSSLRFWRGCAFVGLVAGMVACKGGGPPPQQQQAPPKVTVSRAVLRSVTDYRDYTGRVDAVESVEVRARVKGYLQRVAFKEGFEVPKDELLYEIDPRTFQADVDKAQADVKRLDAQVRLATSEAERAGRLRGGTSISDEEYIQKLAAADVAKASKKSAEASLESAKLELSFTKVTAPISGRVSRTLVTEGNFVNADATLLTTIVKLDPIYVYFEAPERDFIDYQYLIRQQGAPTAQQGKSPVAVGLTDEQGYPHRGVIDFRDNRVDPGTGTILIRGVFDNRDRMLTPGLFVRARVPFGRPQPRILIPEVALMADQRGRFVWVVKPDNTVEYRTVSVGWTLDAGMAADAPEGALGGALATARIGMSLDGLAVIEGGLKPTDWVIVNGLQRARAGAAVTPEEASDSQQSAVGSRQSAAGSPR